MSIAQDAILVKLATTGARWGVDGHQTRHNRAGDLGTVRVVIRCDGRNAIMAAANIMLVTPHYFHAT